MNNNNGDEIRVANYKVALKGDRSVSVTLSPIWISECGIKPGDTLGQFRRPGSSDLILRKVENDLNSEDQ